MTDEYGVQFPLTAGRRSTQRTSREAFWAAAQAVDPLLAEAIRAEEDWRRRYPRHLRALTARAAVSVDAASAIARAGLARLHKTFGFVDTAGHRSLQQAVGDDTGTGLGTRTVTGRRVRQQELVVPYRGEELRGGRIVEQARAWARRGIVEPSFVEAMRRVVEHPEWLDLSGRTFAVLGAGAEMAPTAHLLGWGADVAAIDVPSAAVWERLTAMAEATAGCLHVPTRPDGVDGADLLTEPGRVRGWLQALPGPIVLGNYAYADGAAFVRVAMAADAVIMALGRRRGDLSLTYLATPTDVFAVPPEVVAAARERQRRNRGASMVRALTAGRGLIPNYRMTVRAQDGRELGICDALIIQQGGNYALAKRLQRWRAIVARHDGSFSAMHVAPATLTRSVTKNRVLAAAYAGSWAFGVEAFEPATSRAVMSALLVHDLHHDAAVAHPWGGTSPNEHDLTRDAVHGGLWRVPWEPRSALPIATALGAKALLAR